MLIASKTAFNVYYKFNTLRKYPAIAPLFPAKLHAFYDQTETKLNRIGRLLKPTEFINKLNTDVVQDRKNHKNSWNAAWISYLLELDEWLLNGDLHHIIFRKLALLKVVNARLIHAHSKLKQLVIIGCGLDHLGWLFSDTCTCFELDIKPMISFKKNLLPTQYQRVHFIDFNAIQDSLEQCLTKHPTFNSNEACLFITEGFIDYIPREILTSMISQIKQIHPGNEWLSTHFNRNSLSSKQRFFFELGVQIADEPLQANLTKEQIVTMGLVNGFELNNQWTELSQLVHEKYAHSEAMLSRVEKKVLLGKNMKGCSVLYFT